MVEASDKLKSSPENIEAFKKLLSGVLADSTMDTSHIEKQIGFFFIGRKVTDKEVVAMMKLVWQLDLDGEKKVEIGQSLLSQVPDHTIYKEGRITWASFDSYIQDIWSDKELSSDEKKEKSNIIFDYIMQVSPSWNDKVIPDWAVRSSVEEGILRINALDNLTASEKKEAARAFLSRGISQIEDDRSLELLATNIQNPLYNVLYRREGGLGRLGIRDKGELNGILDEISKRREELKGAVKKQPESPPEPTTTKPDEEKKSPPKKSIADRIRRVLRFGQKSLKMSQTKMVHKMPANKEAQEKKSKWEKDVAKFLTDKGKDPGQFSEDLDQLWLNMIKASKNMKKDPQAFLDALYELSKKAEELTEKFNIDDVYKHLAERNGTRKKFSQDELNILGFFRGEIYSISLPTKYTLAQKCRLAIDGLVASTKQTEKPPEYPLKLYQNPPMDVPLYFIQKERTLEQAVIDFFNDVRKVRDTLQSEGKELAAIDNLLSEMEKQIKEGEPLIDQMLACHQMANEPKLMDLLSRNVEFIEAVSNFGSRIPGFDNTKSDVNTEINSYKETSFYQKLTQEKTDIASLTEKISIPTSTGTVPTTSPGLLNS